MTHPPPFLPGTPLEQCLCAGDLPGLLAQLDGLSPTERVALGPRLARLEVLLEQAELARYSKLARQDPRHPTLQPWGQPVDRSHLTALAAARFVVGAVGARFEPHLPDALLVELARRFKPGGLAAQAAHWPPERVRVRQRLYLDGLLAQPDGEAFVLGLMLLPGASGTRLNALRPGTHDWRTDLDAMLAEDPTLATRLLGLFEHEGNADVSLANTDKYFSHPGRTWADKLLELAHSGVLPRQTLLDKVLGALAHDWPQYRSGWHSRWHDLLAPTADEMRPFARRYLALCHSRIPPTVGMALRALKHLLAGGHDLAASEVLAALVPVLGSGVKAQVADALKLLDSLVKADPAQAAAAAAVACGGLQLDDAALQGQVLVRLQRWGLDAAGRQALATMTPHIAARHQALAASLGTGPAASADAHINTDPGGAPGPSGPAPGPAPAPSSAPATGPRSWLDESRRLAPLDTQEDLVEACASVLADDSQIDLLERVLQALVTGAPWAAAARPAFGPVQKQARKARTPLARELARLLQAVLADGLATDPSATPHGLQRRLSDRISALIRLAQHGAGISPLSCATHRGGAIAPDVLVARASAWARAGISPPLADQRDALLRLVPPGDPATLAAAQALPPSPFSLALRHALADRTGPGTEPRLALAAARIRHVDADDPALLAALGDAGPDGALAARYRWQVRWQPYEVDGKSYPYYRVDVEAGRVPRDTPDDWWPIVVHVPTGWDGEHQPWRVGGDTAAEVAYFATLQPSSLQAFLAEGARLITNHLQWVEAARQLKAYLLPLLDPAVTLGPMGHLLLAAGLGEGESTRATLAIDALLAGPAQERLSLPDLAGPLGQLLWQRVVTPARLRRNLQAAASRDRAAQHTVFALLCGLCSQAGPEATPKGFADLLDLLLDLALALSSTLPESTRQGLTRLDIGGRGHNLRQRLLGLAG